MKVSFRSLSLIAENLSLLYEDGIPIVVSMELLMELPLNKEYKKSLRKIKGDIIKGNSLGQSFYKNSILYPKFFSGIVDIGENSGELTGTLKNLKSFYYNIDNIRRSVKNAVRYPLFIMVLLMLLLNLFFFMVIPNLYETFNSINKNIPFLLKKSYEMYSYFSINKVYTISVIISIVCSCILIVKYVKDLGKEKESRYAFKIKFIKQYYEYIFVMILSTIVNSGMQITEGLDLCIESINIQCVKNEVIKLKKGIFNGEDMVGSLSKSKFLSRYSLSMIAIGEKSGNLDEVLKRTSLRLEKNLMEKLNKLISYIAPAAIIIVAIFIMFFIFMFIIPMMDMVYSGGM